MWRLFRDSTFGRLVYHLSGKKLFLHEEEKANFVVYGEFFLKFMNPDLVESKKLIHYGNGEVEEKIVTWYSDFDSEDPRNWPWYLKFVFIFEISLMTLSVHTGTAIYTPGVEEVASDFGVSQTVAAIPLTLFVVGYGFGSMIFSPMSENAAVGRTYIYIITLFLFMILQIPTFLVTNITGLCILRFLSGLFASPCVSTGVASICDVLMPAYNPIGIGIWSIAIVSGHLFGPLLGSILTVKGGWRWCFRFLFIGTFVNLIMAFFFLPESSEKTLLYKRAKRLRHITGNASIVSEGELENCHIQIDKIILKTLYKPIKITFLEPFVLMIHLYLSVVYAILYIWFEAFPIVFLETKHFTPILTGVCRLSTIAGSIVGAIICSWWNYQKYTKKLLVDEDVLPNVFLPMVFFGGIFMPIGMFTFGWTSSPDLHWIGPLIGAAVFGLGCFVVFQALFNYLGMSFPKFIASVFAGNTLLLSSIGGAFPLFGRTLFACLGSSKYPVGWGSSVLGFITVAMLFIPFFFYVKWPSLQARSNYSGDYDVDITSTLLMNNRKDMF